MLERELHLLGSSWNAPIPSGICVYPRGHGCSVPRPSTGPPSIARPRPSGKTPHGGSAVRAPHRTTSLEQCGGRHGAGQAFAPLRRRK
jgi:hypothetical protein